MNKRTLFESVLLIKNDPRFADFLAHLDAEQDAALQAMVNGADDRAMYVAQGGYKALQRLKDLIGQAPELLDKIVRGHPANL